MSVVFCVNQFQENMKQIVNIFMGSIQFVKQYMTSCSG